MSVGVGVGVSVGEGEGVGVGVSVGEGEGVGVSVGVGEGEGVGVSVGMGFSSGHKSVTKRSSPHGCEFSQVLDFWGLSKVQCIKLETTGPPQKVRFFVSKSITTCTCTCM